MRRLFLSCFILCSFVALGQTDLQRLFKDCNVQGSSTIYDYKIKRWIYTDSLDAPVEMLPASTFKVINLLIALETGVIKDEHDTIKWISRIDTSLYGRKEEVYKTANCVVQVGLHLSFAR